MGTAKVLHPPPHGRAIAPGAAPWPGEAQGVVSGLRPALDPLDLPRPLAPDALACYTFSFSLDRSPLHPPPGRLSTDYGDANATELEQRDGVNLEWRRVSRRRPPSLLPLSSPPICSPPCFPGEL